MGAPWVHRLSDIDPENLTAVCANCGPVEVRRKPRGDRWSYHCRIVSRQWASTPAANARKRRWEASHRAWCGTSCERCGFVAENICQLDVHHLDGNHSNNDRANLQTLCANCHRLIHRQASSDP